MSFMKLKVREFLREKHWTTKILAEKTGLSESYLTHIKNGTRRWNEDALRKIAIAFEIEPLDLLRGRPLYDEPPVTVDVNERFAADRKQEIQIVPVVGELPSFPSEENNRVAQAATGFKGVFMPSAKVLKGGSFCYVLQDNSLSPSFQKGDYLIICPDEWSKTGDVIAVEYGNEKPVKTIMQVSYVEDYIVLESINQKKLPVVIRRGHDHFRVIGKVVFRYQQVSNI